MKRKKGLKEFFIVSVSFFNASNVDFCICCLSILGICGIKIKFSNTPFCQNTVYLIESMQHVRHNSRYRLFAQYLIQLLFGSFINVNSIKIYQLCMLFSRSIDMVFMYQCI